MLNARPVHDWLSARQERLGPVTLIAALVEMGLDGEAIAAELRDHHFLDKVRSTRAASAIGTKLR